MKDIARDLDLAREAIAKEEWSSALTHLLDAWREKRATRIGILIDRVSKRIPATPIAGKSVKARMARWLEVAKKRDSADVGSLLATTWPGKWQDGLTVVEALAKMPDDPRIAVTLAEFLVGVRWEAAAARAFYEPALSLLTRLRDARTAPLLESALRRERTAALDRFRPLYDEALGRIPRDCAALGASEEGALASVEALFASDAKAEKADSEFLEAIYAAPDDNEPRAVYADWLAERGDPRGEFITLQLAMSADPKAKAREAALLKKHGSAWAGALDGVFYEDYREFRRGFFTSGIVRDREGMSQELQHPEWALIESLAFVWFKNKDTADALLAAPFLKELRELSGVPESVLARVASGGLGPNLEEIRLKIESAPSLDDRRAIAIGFPKLKSIGLGEDLPNIIEYLAGPFPKVEKLIVVCHPPPRAEVTKAVADATLDVQVIEFRERLEGDRGLWRLALLRNAEGQFTRLRAGLADSSLPLPFFSYGLRRFIESFPEMEELVIEGTGRPPWPRLELAALEQAIADSKHLRHIQVPWDRDVAAPVARRPRSSVTFGTNSDIPSKLDAIWSAITRPPLSLSFDAFDLDGKGHTPLETDGLTALKDAFATRRTTWMELYRKRSSEIVSAFFRRNLVTVTSPRGTDFDLDVWLGWVVKVLDEIGFDSVQAIWQEWTPDGELRTAYPRKIGPEGKEVGWITGFGPRDAALYDLDKLAKNGRTYPSVRVVRAKEHVLFVFGDTPEYVPTPEEIAAFEANVVAPARRSS